MLVTFRNQDRTFECTSFKLLQSNLNKIVTTLARAGVETVEDNDSKKAPSIHCTIIVTCCNDYELVLYFICATLSCLVKGR